MRNKLRFLQGDETDIYRHAEFSVHFLYVTVNSVTMNTELKFIWWENLKIHIITKYNYKYFIGGNPKNENKINV